MADRRLPHRPRTDRSRGARLSFLTLSRHPAPSLTDCEEDRTLRAVLVGMLREAERTSPSSN
jgi:hypothetical protein